MKDSQYKDHLSACKTEATESRRSLEKIWKEVWQMYRNEQDYSDKQKWQSKICLPEAQAALRKAVGVIRSSMTRMKDFFNVEHGHNPYHMKLRMMNKLRDPDVNFNVHFSEGVGVALLFGIGIVKHTFKIISKRYVEGVMRDEMLEQPGMFGEVTQIPVKTPAIETVDREVMMPCFEVKDPRTTYFLVEDPYKFIIEEEVFDLSEVMSWQDVDGYDKKEVKKLVNSDYGKTPTEETRERLEELGIHEHGNEYRKQVLVQRYWGEITNEKGEVEFKDEKTGKPMKMEYAVANQQFLIMPPREVVYWHGRLPFAICSPISVLLRKTGQSLLESMRGIQRALNNITNLQMDALVYELLGIPEVDVDKLYNPAELTTLVPGRLIRRKPGAMVGPAVTIDRPKSFSNAPVHMVEFLRRAAQNSHFVTDILMGNPQVSGEQATATEVNKKGAESYQAFQIISMDIEDNLLVPLLEMYAINTLQYDDFYDANEPELMQYKSMTQAQRVMALQGPYRFTARGITSFFEQMEMAQNLSQMLQGLRQIPVAQMAVRWPDVLRILMENSRIPEAEKLVLTEEELQKKIQEQQQAQQQQMQMEFQDKERERQAMLQGIMAKEQSEQIKVDKKTQNALQKELLRGNIEMRNARYAPRTAAK